MESNATQLEIDGVEIDGVWRLTAWRLLAVVAGLLLLVAGGSATLGGTDSGPRPAVASPPVVAAVEVDRIRLHLGKVEFALRARETDGLSADQRARRVVALDWLREYRQRGLFPHNHTHPGARVPVFVDEHGTHCAVGYLLKRSGEAALVNDVVATDNNIRVRELAGNERFGNWLEETGLTLGEAAWIQPVYDGRDPDTTAEDVALIFYPGIASGGLALYSHLTEPGPRGLQVAGSLNAALGVLHLGVAAMIAGRDGTDGAGRIAISGVLSAVSLTAAIHRFLRSRDHGVALRAAARNEDLKGPTAGRPRFQVSLPEPAWIHGRPGLRFRAAH